MPASSINIPPGPGVKLGTDPETARGASRLGNARAGCPGGEIMLRSLFATALAFTLVPAALSAQQGEMKDMDTFPRPIAMADNVWIEELTMLEVRDLLEDGWRTALILTGGIEENGPYLTTGKHNHVLRVMGDAIAREFGQTLVAPIVTIEPGNPERASRPGGIRYSQETYHAVLRDYAMSLKAQGFNQIFLMGDSGGNQRGMAAVAEELRNEWAGEDVVIAHIPEYYNYDDVVTYQRDELGVDEDPRMEGLHDDYYITTIIMHDDPEYVRYQERVDAGKASTNGIAITPMEKALAHGQALIDFRTQATVDAMRAAIAEQRGG
jgi:creatinine amidohydrolase